MAIMKEIISPAHPLVKHLVKLRDDAKAGDKAAIKLLFQYVIGKPQPAVDPGVVLSTEPASFAELRALDAATRVRWLPVAPAARRPRLDAAELELLGWIAAARCALSSQAHRTQAAVDHRR